MIGTRILVVEDNTFWAEEIRTFITDALPTCTVRVARDFAEAQRAISESGLCLVVADLGLPPGTGTELGIQLVNKLRDMGIPCIVVSGEESLTKQGIADLFNKSNALSYFDKSILTDVERQSDFRTLLVKYATLNACDVFDLTAVPSTPNVFPSRREELIGMRVSHYRVERFVAVGGMGVVYQAVDTRLNRNVAIKFLSGQYAGDSKMQNRFQREAEAASALNHSHSCKIFDVGKFCGLPFLVMEWLEGQTLKQAIESGTLTVRDAMLFVVQVLEALAEAHDMNILHRDIKPQNIFLSTPTHAKLLDFGLAKAIPMSPLFPAEDGEVDAIAESITSDGTLLGTPNYMAPEQARGETLDVRSDLFSVGVVLYEATTGMLPFSGATAPVVFDKILNTTPQMPRSICEKIPRQLESIIMRALSKVPSDRFHAARDMSNAIQDVLLTLESPKSQSVFQRVGNFFRSVRKWF